MLYHLSRQEDYPKEFNHLIVKCLIMWHAIFNAFLIEVIPCNRAGVVTKTTNNRELEKTAALLHPHTSVMVLGVSSPVFMPVPRITVLQSAIESHLCRLALAHMVQNGSSHPLGCHLCSRRSKVGGGRHIPSLWVQTWTCVCHFLLYPIGKNSQTWASSCKGDLEMLFLH